MLAGARSSTSGRPVTRESSMKKLLIIALAAAGIGLAVKVAKSR
ncbi:hypothetical protein BH11ACT8_BH11ACT8_14140 [soil metagenome]